MVMGTTIAELGNRNRPLDMIVYKKDGNGSTAAVDRDVGLLAHRRAAEHESRCDEGSTRPSQRNAGWHTFGSPSGHSTIARTNLETHRVGATTTRGRPSEGQDHRIDTTLEANAAMRHRPPGHRRELPGRRTRTVSRHARGSGATGSVEQRLDARSRCEGPERWPHASAHKAEHAVDMETGAIVAVTLRPMSARNDDRGGQASSRSPFPKGVRAGPVIGPTRAPVYGNRRRMRGRRGRRLMRQRGERIDLDLYAGGIGAPTDTNILKRLDSCGWLNLGLGVI